MFNDGSGGGGGWNGLIITEVLGYGEKRARRMNDWNERLDVELDSRNAPGGGAQAKMICEGGMRSWLVR